MDCKVFILLQILLLGIASADNEYKFWSWDDSSEKVTAKREAVEPRVMNRNDEYVALPSIEQQTIQEFNPNVTEASDDEVIEEILKSGRQGRNIEGLDDVYSDPIVKQALDNGDDTQARNLIREKLCDLGLMQCDEVVQRYPTRVIYTQPPSHLNSNVRPPYRPPPQKNPYAPRPQQSKIPYGPPQPIPLPNGPPRKVGYAQNSIYNNKPLGPVYDNKYSGGFIGEESSQTGIRFGYTEKPNIIVNQGAKLDTAASNVQIHHHYHHVDGTKQDPPKTIVVNNPIPVQPIITQASGHNSEYSSLSGSYQQGATGYDGGFNPSSPDYDYKGANSGFGSNTGLYSDQSANKPVYEAGQANRYAGQSGQYSGQSGQYAGQQNPSQTQALFSDNSLYSNQQGLYGNTGTQGSFHASAPDIYKKELNINGPPKTNGLGAYNQYSQNKYSQQNQYNLGEKFQGSESARQDQFDCVCVPFNQCPATDIVGRRDDLILPLDPRNLGTEIEAESEANSTVVEKDTKSVNITESTGEKKVAKREVQKADGEGVSIFVLSIYVVLILTWFWNNFINGFS